MPGLQMHTPIWLFHGLQESELRSSGSHVIPILRKQKQEDRYKLKFQVSQDHTPRSSQKKIKMSRRWVSVIPELGGWNQEYKVYVIL